MSKTSLFRSKKLKVKEEDQKRITKLVKSQNNSIIANVAVPRHIEIILPKENSRVSNTPRSYRKSPSLPISAKPEPHPGEAAFSGPLSAHPVKTMDDIASSCPRIHDHYSFPSACISPSHDVGKDISPLKQLPSPRIRSPYLEELSKEVISCDSFANAYTLEARMNQGSFIPPTIMTTARTQHQMSYTKDERSHVVNDKTQHQLKSQDELRQQKDSSSSGSSANSESTSSQKKKRHQAKHHRCSRMNKKVVRNHSPTPDELFLPPHNDTPKEDVAYEKCFVTVLSPNDLRQPAEADYNITQSSKLEIAQETKQGASNNLDSDKETKHDAIAHAKQTTSLTQKRLRDSNLFVTFTVGVKYAASDYITQQAFLVFRHYLKKSKVLYPLGIQAGHDPIIRPDIEPKAFELYLEYACTGLYQFPEHKSQWTSKREPGQLLSWQECRPLLNAHILGVKIKDESFTDYIMDLLVANVDSSVCPDEELISHLFTASDVSEPLKQFVVRVYIDSREAGVGIESLGEHPKSFLISALTEALARRSGAEKEEPDTCKYHVHGPRGTCYIVRRAKQKKRKEKYDLQRRRITQGSMSAVDEAAQNGVRFHDWACEKPPSRTSSVIQSTVHQGSSEDEEIKERTPGATKIPMGVHTVCDEKKPDAMTTRRGPRGNSTFGSEDVGQVDSVQPSRSDPNIENSVIGPASDNQDSSPVYFESFPPFSQEYIEHSVIVESVLTHGLDEGKEEESVELADVLEHYKAYYQCPGAFPLVDYSPSQSVRGSAVG